MALVLNASCKMQSVQVHGSWFEFAPGQIKSMNEDKVFFLSSTKAYQGFVSVSDRFEDPGYQNTPEGKAELAEAKQNGVNSRIAHLEWLKHNELKSLRGDMDKANIKADVASEMSTSSSKALVSALEELKEYRAKSNDDVQDTMKKVQELEKALAEEMK